VVTTASRAAADGACTAGRAKSTHAARAILPGRDIVVTTLATVVRCGVSRACRITMRAMRKLAFLLTAALCTVAGCGGGGGKTVSGPPPKAPSSITLRSPAFTDGAEIPKQYTCDGDSISPPLVWSSVPRKAKELALLVEDPDAPGGTFVHWTAWGIPTTASQIPP